MPQRLIDYIRSAVASFIATSLGWASVAISFIIALGLVTAALGLELTEQFGATNALWTLGAGYCAIGLVASFAITMKERQELDAAEEQERDEGGMEEMTSAAVTQAATHLPSVLGILLQSTSTWALPAARLAGRNMPLVLLLLLVALLLWPTEPTEEGTEQEDDAAGGQEVSPEEERLREAA